MVAVAAGTILLGVPVLVASGTVVAGARAANAADAAALAAADAMLGIAVATDTDPCGLAGELATRHGATVARCDLAESQLEARITVVVRSGLMTVTREARAGPPHG